LPLREDRSSLLGPQPFLGHVTNGLKAGEDQRSFSLFLLELLIEFGPETAA